MPQPQKGFGDVGRSNLPPTGSSGGGSSKPPGSSSSGGGNLSAEPHGRNTPSIAGSSDGGGMKPPGIEGIGKPPMGPRKSPWIEVPDDWLDDKYSRDDSYRAIQEYFGLKIKPDVVNEYLIGKGILPDVKIEVVRFSAKEIAGEIGIDATLGLTGITRSGTHGTDSIEIYRTIDSPGKECRFDKLGASSVNMKGFGVEYYRRVVPFLRKIGIEKIETTPTTGMEESREKYYLIGAYVWSFYGYTNANMAGTLEQYIDYLKGIKNIKLSQSEENAILNIARMKTLAQDFRGSGANTGKQFLLGMDANDNPTRSIWWDGTHHNINDESDSNIEMRELIGHLLYKMK